VTLPQFAAAETDFRHRANRFIERAITKTVALRADLRAFEFRVYLLSRPFTQLNASAAVARPPNAILCHSLRVTFAIMSLRKRLMNDPESQSVLNFYRLER
jgi:hypothetical protein